MRLKNPKVFCDINGQLQMMVSDTTQCYGECIFECPIIIKEDTILNKVSISHATEIGKGVRLSYCSIGELCTIGEKTRIVDPDLDYISRFYFKGSEWDFIEHTTLEKRVTDTYSRKNTCIGNNVWIGIGVTIAAGVRIGDGAVIEDGSYVTKDVPAQQIWSGSPASYIMDREGKHQPDRVAFGESSFVIDADKQVIIRREKDFVDIIYKLHLDKEDRLQVHISKGGVDYDPIDNALFVRGWGLPGYAYDRIKIFADDEFIGDATLRIRREDVFRNTPDCHDLFSGFFIKKIR